MLLMIKLTIFFSIYYQLLNHIFIVRRLARLEELHKRQEKEILRLLEEILELREVATGT